MILRPHQEHVLAETDRLTSQGVRRICVTAPTGAGKSLMMVEEAIRAINRGKRVGLFTPRKLLTDQIIDYFESKQVPFSVRAAGYEDQWDDNRAIQICSVKTEHKRVKSMKLPPLGADLLLIDEAHMQATGVNREIIDQNYDAGADIIGYTATPLGLKTMYQELVIGGKPSELRKAGFLLPAYIYEAPTTDLSKIERLKTGEFSNKQLQDSGFVQAILGDVISHYKRLNPHGLPTILFAPGLAESKWFVDQFQNAGITAAHIDGDNLYYHGAEYRRDSEAKDQLIADVRRGRVQVLCNRFVCREGVDIPELFYGILACPIGSLTSYLQAIGRLLRPSQGLDRVLIADHGGNKDRHGSPNEDREWEHIWGLTQQQVELQRKVDLASGKKDKGFACHNCNLVWGTIPASGVCSCGADLTRTYECNACKHKHRYWPLDCKCVQCGASMSGVRKKKVIERPGQLVLKPDLDYRPQRKVQVNQSEKLWQAWYYKWVAMAKKGKDMNLAKAFGLYSLEHYQKFGCAPPRNLKLMPKDAIDWHVPVSQVPRHKLR